MEFPILAALGRCAAAPALTRQHSEAMRSAAPGKGVVPVEPGTIPLAKREEPTDIVTRPSILCIGNTWTIVPRGAVIPAREAFAQSGQVVVSVCHEGPISVLPHDPDGVSGKEQEAGGR